jgi:hypothetical protein
VCVCVCVCVYYEGACALLYLCVYDSDSNPRITFHVRIANRVVKGSRCRGGIVHIRDGCSFALSVRLSCAKALWQPRVSTSDSLTDRY